MGVALSPDICVSTDKLILSVIEQEHTWYKHPKEAFDKVEDALAKQVGLLTRLYDSSGGEPSYVLDTNALLYNPVLEKWRFDGTAKFTLILTPTVLSELDELKVTHRHETVRQKAETLIRQIKEYRRRGKLTDGVPLVNAVSNILAIATEPDMHHSFPWLDANNKDDRIIAAMVEIMRKRSRSPVILVSRDINIQNKAEFAGLPFVEPPDVV